MDNKIGCSFGEGTTGSRTRIIDPNNFYGENDSSRNIPVNNEDLTISVKLTTRKKARTTLSTDITKDESSVVEQSGASINFIEGSDINGKKVLTTKFTELTTVFEKDVFNPETFGVTNIDIDFNSSYTPMVKIDFIDVKGSSIFQNEENILNGTGNKYSTFFEFPYPMFELEIKGYYGKPVTYCLHMLKFNSKFNSKTGNFEISCEFIGYTYALLSDMLIGILRVIPFTRIGEEKFRQYNEGLENPIINLVELKGKIDNIANEIKKISETTEEAKIIKTFKIAEDELDSLRVNFNNFQELGSGEKSTNNNFVILDNETFSNEQNIKYNVLKNNITESITKYNELNISGLSLDNTKIKAPIKINNLSKKILNSDVKITIPSIPNQSNVELFKTDLNNYINNDYKTKFDDDYIFSVFDLRDIFKIISEQEELIKTNLKDTQKSLANSVKGNVVSNLGFKPTIRNMVEIFTALIEVFIETIYEVSQSAELSSVRKDLFNNVFDVDGKNSDYVKDDKNYYPWPAYSEKENDKSGYIDKYLGDNKTLKNKVSEVPELEFIDDLLNAFLKAKTRDEELSELNAKDEISYYPVNPLNTKLFSLNGNPYAIKDLISEEQIKRQVLIRAMLFLGYTNDPSFLTEDEILKMAEIEVNALLSGLKNPKLKPNLANLTKESIIGTFGKINTTDSKVINDYTDNNYYYTYFYRDGVSLSKDGVKLLPLNSDLVGLDVPIPTNANALLEFKETGNIFLTNYGSGIVTTSETKKFDDGGIYVKIFTIDEFNQNILPLVNNIDDNPENIISLETLKADSFNIASSGFNSLGGSYGIQEFVNMNFGDDKILPLFYNFYKNSGNNPNNVQPNTYSISLTRKNKKNLNYDSENEQIRLVKVDIYTQDKKNIYDSNADFLDIINEENKNLTYPYIDYKVYSRQNLLSGAWDTFSLFGSSWYYLQEDAKSELIDGTTEDVSNYVKGLLFLNTIPFNNDFNNKNYSDPLHRKELARLFNIKGGFVHVPRLWVAYIGSILWWMSSDDPEIENGLVVGGGRGKKDPVIWKWSCDIDFDEDYIPKSSSPTSYQNRQLFPKVLNTDETIKINESLLAGLPEQAKNEFKRVFFEFVNNDFIELKENLEIKKGTNQEFCTFLEKIKKRINDNGFIDINNQQTPKLFINLSVLKENLNNVDNYNVIIPNNYSDIGLKKEWYDYSLFLELKDNTDATIKLVSLFKEEFVIANTSWVIWDKSKRSNISGPYVDEFTKLRQPIGVPKSVFDVYFTQFITILKDQLGDSSYQNEEQKELNAIFGISNKNDIKLMLYRHCKNIYDKWLGGVTNIDNVIFQCGADSNKDSNRKTTDLKISEKYKRKKVRLIDSFRFVTRSFKDIGDELFVDPTPIGGKTTESPNISAYAVISQLLNDNKFEFIALPSYINYRDDKTLESVFTPYQYSDNITSCGPTFVCVYTGQKSNSLDIKSGKYPNDGFDMRCGSKTIPADFTEPLNDYEEPISVFEVNYSQQNQNIFKDITLDQSEFTETEESLKIIQDISMKGAENSPSTGGQNMYNIYAVRSYSAEIEMLGNAMIQPMMYFQLNNIPMFHGAYMIIRTKHNITPNHMTTRFTGTRIRAVETPIIDISDAYMNLIETLDLSSVGTSRRASVSGSLAPIVRTIVENGGSNGNVEVGNIKVKPILFDNLKAIGDPFNKKNIKSENLLLSEAVDPLVNMLNDWTDWMGENGFNGVLIGNKKVYAYITSIFRNYEKQINIKKQYGDGAAPAGSSPHGWGIAVDLQYLNKNGEIIKNDKNTASSFDIEKNPAIKWLYDNAYTYGWVLPHILRDGVNLDEHWHWEYHGTAAKCLVEKNPNIYGYKINTSINLKSFVKNPKDKNNIEAVYTDCDYKIANTGDGAEVETILSSKADYWSLVAICAAENFKDNPQGMADVAQSIYNRLNTPNKPYGKSIKEIIVSPKQYEPTFKNVGDWKQINSKETAIMAFMNSKKFNKKTAEEFINISINAIKNETLRQNSLNFVGTRTEFLAKQPSNSEAKNPVVRAPENKNNVFFWRYAGIALINSQPITGPTFNV